LLQVVNLATPTVAIVAAASDASCRVIASGQSIGTPWLADTDGPIPDVASEKNK
jgi:hypothetical protein